MVLAKPTHKRCITHIRARLARCMDLFALKMYALPTFTQARDAELQSVVLRLVEALGRELVGASTTPSPTGEMQESTKAVISGFSRYL